MKVDGTGAISVRKGGRGGLISTKVGASQQKAFKATLPRTDHLRELQEGGVLVVGQWCSYITMDNCDFCMGCMALWMPPS